MNNKVIFVEITFPFQCGDVKARFRLIALYHDCLDLFTSKLTLPDFVSILSSYIISWVMLKKGYGVLMQNESLCCRSSFWTRNAGNLQAYFDQSISHFYKG